MTTRHWPWGGEGSSPPIHSKCAKELPSPALSRNSEKLRGAMTHNMRLAAPLSDLTNFQDKQTGPVVGERTQRLITLLGEDEQRRSNRRKQMIHDEQRRLFSELSQEIRDDIMCLCCATFVQVKDIFFLKNCTHYFCKSCLEERFTSALKDSNTEMACLRDSCPEKIGFSEMRDVIGNTRMEAHLSTLLHSLAESKKESFAKCPISACGAVYERIPVPLDNNETITDSSRARLRCPECCITFCCECGAAPYHSGMDCAKYQEMECVPKCRYCERPLLEIDFESLTHPNLCDSSICRSLAASACLRTLPCGHQCYGMKYEMDCLTCLHPDCQQMNTLMSQRGDDLCFVCQTDPLHQAPCLRLDCGHVFHGHCIKERLRNRWPGIRLTFGYLECPIVGCGELVQHSSLSTELRSHMELFREVKTRGLQRMEFEGLGSASALTDPGSPFYGDPVGFSLENLSYYECYKCQKPYFAGLASCERSVDDDLCKAEERICGGCSPIGKNETTCKIHGKKYMEYKCRFCCNIANWFCWGSTHMCDTCHMNSTAMYHKKKSKLPACVCNRAHPANGEEFCFGCAACRYLGTTM